MLKSELKELRDLYSEANENIFAGIMDNDSDDKEEKDDSDNEEKDEKTEDSSDDSEDKDSSDDTDSEDKESDSGTEDKDEGDSEESSEEDSEEDGDGEVKDKTIQKKIQDLESQYNDLLVDAFEKYAPECIQDALDESETAFGENIEEILDNALAKLKDSILNELGIEKEEEGMVALTFKSDIGEPDGNEDESEFQSAPVEGESDNSEED